MEIPMGYLSGIILNFLNPLFWPAVVIGFYTRKSKPAAALLGAVYGIALGLLATFFTSTRIIATEFWPVKIMAGIFLSLVGVYLGQWRDSLKKPKNTDSDQ